MSGTVRRIKYKEKDVEAINMKREIERIELEEALHEADNIYDDEDSDPFQLSDHQLMDDSYNPFG